MERLYPPSLPYVCMNTWIWYRIWDESFMQVESSFQMGSLHASCVLFPSVSHEMEILHASCVWFLVEIFVSKEHFNYDSFCFMVSLQWIAWLGMKISCMLVWVVDIMDNLYLRNSTLPKVILNYHNKILAWYHDLVRPNHFIDSLDWAILPFLE